ncbi:MshP protein [Photobacterium nomapromontoriensis]|uniref:MshP protein n=1 Tax=Photobacterium nomapromontoriensis TaxID=2910237 RepID=UPI003D0CB44A
MFYSKQRGSALIVAIFVITVMALFAAAMIRIDWSGQDLTTREVFSTRAWYAAHSGNEYVLSKLFPLGQKASSPVACTQYTLNASAFSCQRVTVTCTQSEYSDNGQPAHKYQLESRATCGTGNFATTRIQETWAKDLEANQE